MRSKVYPTTAFLLLIAAFSVAGSNSMAQAEVIDKIAAVVDGRIITLSDIRKEHQLGAVLGDPVETDDVQLKSLIDRALLEGEMAQVPGLDVSESEIDERMKSIQDLRGMALPDIRNAISQRIQRDRYKRQRYRQFIVVSNEDIRIEYESVFVPEAKRRGIDVPDLSQVQNEIREILFESKVSDEIEDSLKALRARSNIEIFQ
jgi:parvulin-like peptidyl-prolyl isomerase